MMPPPPPPASLLTLIITTSPTPSAPSTELLTSVFASFHKFCPDLLNCRVVIVFDTYDRVAAKSRLKKGQVTAEEAQAFETYKSNVKALVLQEFEAHRDSIITIHGGEAEYGSPGCSDNSIPFTASQTAGKRVIFIEPQQRLGFSLAVRSALSLIDTSYVWVHQHDWKLTASIPLSSLLDVMQTSEADKGVPVKYICFPSVRMLSYAVQHDTLRFSALRALTVELKRDFIPRSSPEIVVPLTPLFFWHDKPHIASTIHYLGRVFPSRYAVRRGEFIEDTIGQRARTQMKEGQWHKWASWLYYPQDGKQLCLIHLDGRVWRGVAGELRQKEIWMAKHQANNTAQQKLVVQTDVPNASIKDCPATPRSKNDHPTFRSGR